MANIDVDAISLLKDGLSDKKKFGKSENFAPMMRSGIDYLDYTMGKWDYNTRIAKIGIQGGGRMIGFVGASGSGKTTLAIQAVSNWARQSDKAMIFHFDFEHATDETRFRQLSGYSKEEYDRKVSLRNSSINAEKFGATVKEVARIKMENEEAFMEDITYVNEQDEEVTERHLAPTFFLIDSLATMQATKVSDKAEDGEFDTNMGGSAQAKFNSGLFRYLFGSSTLTDANINIVYINHVTKKIIINPYAPKQKTVRGLQDDENLPGGSAVVFYTDTMIRLTPGAKLHDDKDYKIPNSFYTNVEVLKSRAAPSGRKIKLILTQTNGFDNLLSNYDALMSMGYISAAGRSSNLKGWKKYAEENGLEEVKFNKGTFQEAYHANPEFANYFDETVRYAFLQMIAQGDNFNNTEEPSDTEEDVEE